MDIFHAVTLGVVEGITEFLPISSTGHLILFGELLNIIETDFVKTFYIFIQLGALLAVIVLYWKLFLDRRVIRNIVAGFVPTALIGLTLYKFVKDYLLSSPNVVLGALIVGGIIMILIEMNIKENEREMGVGELSLKDCVKIGFFQSLALIPGTSRSAATIVGGLIMKIPRKTIIKYSFLLGSPTIVAATGLDLLKSNIIFSVNEITLMAVGFFVSFIVALFAIKLLEKIAHKNIFIAFGIYRIAIAVIIFFIL